MEIFDIDEVTKLPTLNAVGKSIASLKEIFTRLKPIDGDRDGSKKVHNMKELSWIYFSGKYNSRFKLLHGKERDDAVKKLVGLSEDWKPDPLILQGLQDFKECQVTESTPLVDVLIKAIQSITKYAETAATQMESAGLDRSQEVSKYLDNLDRIPTTVEGLRKAKETLSREQDALAKGKKGRNTNLFEMPDK